MKKTILTILALVTAVNAHGAITIAFGSEAEQIARTSSGANLPNGFTFAVGTFNSFTPTALNVSDWASNWVNIGTGSWSSVEFEGDFLGEFFGSGTLVDNSQAVIGNDLYIWGYNTQTPGIGTEWILFDNDNGALAPNDWSVPTAAGINPTKIIDPAQAGTTAVLGSLFTLGNDPYFQTAAVVPEPAHYAGILGAVALLVGLIRRRK